MAGKFALVIGNSHYEDANLRRLKAPDVDVRALESVLRSPDIGRFDEVTTLLNEGGASVRRAVARFYDQRQRDDLLFLYFSGHGVKDDHGHLYLALRDTEITLLAGSAIETAFISARMDRSYSKRQVLVLDCCHSGAFAHGTKNAQGASVGIAEAFQGTGLGRVILTATDATQYAWEGDQVTGDTPNSLFTHYLIDGLKTGAADQDADGVVTVGELFDYVREQVVTTTPRQTPQKWTYRQQGEIILAQNPFAKRSTLPDDLKNAIVSKLSNVRLEAVASLDTLLRGEDVGQSRAALAALKDLSQDDSRKVANAATDALRAHTEEQSGPRVSQAKIPSPANDRRDEQPPPAAADDRFENRPTDVFISYAHQDRETAKALAQVLSAQGWNVWWDRKIAPGESFDIVIERELRTCKCAIVLWSAQSVDARWVRNEARRAAKRQVLLPVLIDAVETPLEFENLQSADLTSWEPTAAHPELDAILYRIGQLAPIPPDRLAGATVERARREFAAGHYQAAVESLERFRPAHPLVRTALTELRAEAEQLERARVEAARREQEAADRHRALGAARTDIDNLLARGDLQAAERALVTVETQFGAADVAPLRKQWMTLQAQAQLAERAGTAVEAARRDFAAGRHQAALASLEQFQPAHPLVTTALTKLRAEAEQLERARVEAARREQEAADRHRALSTARTRIEGRLDRGELEAAEQALATAETQFGAAEVSPLRAQWTTLQAQAQADAQARTAVEAARLNFAAGHHQAAVASLEQFRPEHPAVIAALTELRAEAEQRERARVETARWEQEAADRHRALGAARTGIKECLDRGELEAAGQALAAAETQFGAAEVAPLRAQWTTLQAQAQADAQARTAVEAARRNFTAGHYQAAVASLEQFRPEHPAVITALTELRGEADQLERVERARVEAARREQEAAGRRRELRAARTRIKGCLDRGELEAAEQALATAETQFGAAEVAPLRAQWTTLQAQADAQAAVDAARRSFAAGHHQAAVANLEQFRPAHPLVTTALTELRAEAEQLERARVEAAGREQETADRHRALSAAHTRIDELLGRGDLQAAEQGLAAAETQFGAADVAPLRKQWTTLQAQAQLAERAGTAVEAARRDFAAGRHQAALASLEQFQPAHPLVTTALTKLRAEAEQLERARVEAARREQETADRHRALGAARTDVDNLLARGDLQAAERALVTVETQFGAADVAQLRKQWMTLQAQAQLAERAGTAVEAARRDFAAGRHQAALAGLEQFQPAHPLVTTALTKLRAEAEQIERDRKEAARREKEAARLERVREEERRAAAETQAAANARALETRARETRGREEQEQRPQQIAKENEQPAQAQDELVTARMPQRQRAIYFGGAAALLVLTVGTWLATRPTEAPNPPSSQTQESSPPVPSLPPVVEQPTSAQADASTQKPLDGNGQPTKPTPTVDGALAGQQPADNQPVDSARTRELEALRSTASQQLKTGQREQSLATAVAGLKMNPKDVVLNRIVDDLFLDAQSRTDRARQEAANEGRGLAAIAQFSQGVQKEAEAARYRGAGRNEAAIRSHWGATGDFTKAAGRYKQLAAEASEQAAQQQRAADAAEQAAQQQRAADAAEQARLKQLEDEKTKKAVRPPPPPDREAIQQLLDKYTEAYRNMNAGAIVALHPTVQRNQLDTTFAQSRSYAMTMTNVVISISGNTAVVTCTISINIRPRVGDAQPFTRATTLWLERRGVSWIIVDRR